jgi:hypothetical protein
MIFELFLVFLILVAIFFYIGTMTSFYPWIYLSGFILMITGFIVGSEGLELHYALENITYTTANQLSMAVIPDLFIVLGLAIILISLYRSWWG